jgi:exopolyphosphatase/guanosine-5'-triphosphate,3'-diphosphate pyrophosphatase
MFVNKCLAAVDMGTNSFHLIIVKASDNGSIEIIDRKREVLRLSSEEGSSFSLISDSETEKSIRTLKKFKVLADQYKAILRAVATSAVREANNQEQFLDQVYKETGIHVEVIDGKREAELIYLGASKAKQLTNKKALCIDIGGGSTEIILGDKGTILFSDSIKVGTVRLTRKFFPDYTLSENTIEFCSKFVEEQILLSQSLNFEESFEIAVGTSGTIQSIASLISFNRKKGNNLEADDFSFTYSELISVSELILSKKNLEQRLTIAGIETKRADILPAGVIILNKIFQLFNIERMFLSGYALREGIIFDMLEKIKAGKS